MFFGFFVGVFFVLIFFKFLFFNVLWFSCNFFVFFVARCGFWRTFAVAKAVGAVFEAVGLLLRVL